MKGLEKGELLTVLLKHLQNRAQDKAQNSEVGLWLFWVGLGSKFSLPF